MVREGDSVLSQPPRRRAAKLAVEERQAQLLSCALRVFARKGIASAGHADVAAVAGVAVPTVFSYFPTRAALVDAVLEEVERVIMGRAYAAAQPFQTVPEQLFAVLHDFVDSLDQSPEYATIWVNWGANFNEDTWPLYERFVETTIRLHRDVIDAGLKRGEPLEDVDPEMSALLFVGAATVIVQMKMQRRDPESITRYIETIRHGALYQR